MASERCLGAATKHLPSWGIDALCSATLRLLYRQEAVGQHYSAAFAEWSASEGREAWDRTSRRQPRAVKATDSVC